MVLLAATARGIKPNAVLVASEDLNIMQLYISSPQALPPTTMALSIYCTSITAFFILIKLANYRLHLMFDEGEAVVRSSLSDLSKAPEKKSNASDSCVPASIR